MSNYTPDSLRALTKYGAYPDSMVEFDAHADAWDDGVCWYENRIEALEKELQRRDREEPMAGTGSDQRRLAAS